MDRTSPVGPPRATSRPRSRRGRARGDRSHRSRKHAWRRARHPGPGPDPGRLARATVRGERRRRARQQPRADGFAGLAQLGLAEVPIARVAGEDVLLILREHWRDVRSDVGRDAPAAEQGRHQALASPSSTDDGAVLEPAGFGSVTPSFDRCRPPREGCPRWPSTSPSRPRPRRSAPRCAPTSRPSSDRSRPESTRTAGRRSPSGTSTPGGPASPTVPTRSTRCGSPSAPMSDGRDTEDSEGVTWEPELEELARRTELAHRMGGEEKVSRHRDRGKLTVRERIDGVLDPDSFHEIGGLTGRATTGEDGEMSAFTPTNFVMGRGRIEGRPVVVGGDDFTVRGGAADASIFQKQVYAEQMANELRLPMVRLVDGSGGGGSVKSLETDRRSFVPFNPGWEWVVANLATVPVVSLCLGSVAGLGAARVVTSHYSLMVADTAQLFVAGPPLVNRLGIETVDKETLGGAAIHGRNGVVDDVVDSEAEAFSRARRFLGYLPPSIDELAPRAEPDDDPDRREDWLIGAIPRERRRVYRVRPIVDAIVDRDSCFEIGAGHGRAAVPGLARLVGWPVAVLAGADLEERV